MRWLRGNDLRVRCLISFSSFIFNYLQKSTACWWPFPPFWHPGSQLFLKALKSLMCLECARKTLTLGDMSANGVKEDKVSRIFFFVSRFSFVLNENQNSPTHWNKQKPHKQHKLSIEYRMWYFPFCTLTSSRFNEEELLKDKSKLFLQCWAAAGGVVVLGGRSLKPQTSNTPKLPESSREPTTAASSFPFLPKTESDCLSRKCCCHGCRLIMEPTSC